MFSIKPDGKQDDYTRRNKKKYQILWGKVIVRVIQWFDHDRLMVWTVHCARRVQSERPTFVRFL